MGSINSRPINDVKDVNRHSLKSSNRFSSIPYSPSLLSSNSHQNNENDDRYFHLKRRLCLKKKVLILGLDGVGKTDLFNRLVCWNTKRSKNDLPSQPTLGYNVETIKLRCYHLCHPRYHKVTLWDCGGQSCVRSLWPYHYSNTSLLLWLINAHDRSKLDTSVHLLSRILTNPLLFQVPVLIVLYNSPFERHKYEKTDEEMKQNLLTNLEVAFRFLATLSTTRASTFKWQVINVTMHDNDFEGDFNKIRQWFQELMDL